MDIELDGKKLVKYEDFIKNSLRNNLSQQEHIRWNYFMIMNGFIPSLKCIKEVDYDRRVHWNITNNDGLQSQEKISKTIKYDYQILDDLYWFIRKYNMKIVNKKEEK